MPAPVLDVTRLSLEIPLGQAFGLTIPVPSAKGTKNSLRKVTIVAGPGGGKH